MEKRSKKAIIIGITSLFLVMILLLGLTYAYYRTRIIGNDAETSINVQSKLLEIKYQNESAYIVANGIEPGYTATKTFEVANTGTETVYYSIILDNITNTFIRYNDWTYTLKEEDKVLKSGNIPQSTSYITYKEEILAGETKNYSLTINYANLTTEDQSEDMGRKLSLRINIGDQIGELFTEASSNTLLAAIGNNNVISEPLTIPGKNPSNLIYREGSLNTTISSVNVNTTNANNYWVYGTGYEFNEETGLYSLTGVNIGKYSEIYTELKDKYIINFTGSSSETSAEKSAVSSYEKLFKVESANYNSTGNSKITSKIKNFASVSKSEAILSSTEDDYGTSYYFRGQVENNYVNFSGMCWKIVRVEGNGNIKIVLVNDNYECNDSSLDFKNSNGIAKVANHSAVNNILNAWLNGTSTTYKEVHEGEDVTTTYTKKIDTNKLAALEQSLWCVDYSYYAYIDQNDPDIGMIEWAGVDGTGYYTLYGAYGRLLTAKPSLKCDFTGENNTSAKKQSKYIGELTADEVAFAGTISGQKSAYTNFYLNYNSNDTFWTSSPYGEAGPSICVDSYYNDFDFVYDQGLNHDGYGLSYDGNYVKPVVILPSNSIASTNQSSNFAPGTYQNPYVIE